MESQVACMILELQVQQGVKDCNVAGIQKTRHVNLLLSIHREVSCHSCIDKITVQQKSFHKWLSRYFPTRVEVGTY